MITTAPNPSSQTHSSARSRVVQQSICLAGLIAVVCSLAYAQEAASQFGTAKIAWSKQPGVTTYRLQIANDERFQDVLFDRLLDGNEYIVNDLPPAHYYWRVAIQSGPNGVHFLKATPFDVKVGSVASIPKVKPAAQLTSIADSRTRTKLAVAGWSFATGEVVRLLSAQLRAGSSPDFVGVNAEGTVYALDGARGIPLWKARFNLGSSGDERVRAHYNQFGPLLLTQPGKPSRLLVAFDKGVRALDGSTGREIWNTKIAGVASSGSVIGNDIYLVGEKANKLLILDSATGQLKSQMRLKDYAIGPPLLIHGQSQRQLLVPLRAALVELRGLDGKYIRSFRVGTEITTLPVIVPTSRGSILLIGLKNGIISFDASTVEPLSRIPLGGNDYPIGTLGLVDLDGDKFPEVVINTNGGRVVVIDPTAGKIKWSADIGALSTPAFADLDGDARLDVIVPSKSSLAVGLSGLSGDVIWRSDEDAVSTNTAGMNARPLAVSRVNDGRLMVVSNCGPAAGLRALEVLTSTKSNP